MKHKYFKCPQPCEKVNCIFCDGGLADCTVCNGGEGQLTTDCCGHRLPHVTHDHVWKGLIDYTDKDGWIALK